MAQNKSTLTWQDIDNIFKGSNIGSIQQAIGNSFYGINHRQMPTATQSNRERYGYTFFTRPQLNMTDQNLSAHRLFYPLMTNNRNTIQNYSRTILDPRIALIMKPTLCDPYNAFIPVMTNNITDISGWNDLIAESFTSQSGNYNESISFIDSNVLRFDTYDISATFRNTRGDPIIYMIYIWLLYSTFVFEGTCMPYPDMVIENEIDYNTRIYRLVMDKTNTYVRKILATGACFPTSLPIGNFFDFTSDTPTNQEIYKFSINFRCMGIIYQDPILIKEFNEVVEIFNPAMSDNFRSQEMTKVPKEALVIFNNRGYPRINPATYELEWYVPTALYNNRLEVVANAGGPILNTSYSMLSEVSQQIPNASQIGTPVDIEALSGYVQSLKTAGPKADTAVPV